MTQNTNSHDASNQSRTHSVDSPYRIRLLVIAIFLLAVTLITILALSSASRPANPSALLQAFSQNVQQTWFQLTGNPSNSANPPSNMTAFEQRARQLAATGSDESLQTLTQMLNSNESLSQRDTVITLLTNAPPNVAPILAQATTDPNPGVRAGAVQVLGLRHEYQAVGILTNATQDADARVRRQAAQSLGEIYAWQVLPRIEAMQVDDNDHDVRQAAVAAQTEIKKQMAKEIGLADSSLIDVAVTTNDLPRLYAVTDRDLYTRNGTSWQRVGQLPDIPLTLATGADNNLIYLSTIRNGLYRSVNGGADWEHVHFGLQTPTQVTVTALTVDPQNSHRLYAALASPNLDASKLDPLGIYVSSDSADTWFFLPDAPINAITKRLVIDLKSPGYLYGIANDTPWRYQLPDRM